MDLSGMINQARNYGDRATHLKTPIVYAAFAFAHQSIRSNRQERYASKSTQKCRLAVTKWLYREKEEPFQGQMHQSLVGQRLVKVQG